MGWDGMGWFSVCLLPNSARINRPPTDLFTHRLFVFLGLPYRATTYLLTNLREAVGECWREVLSL